MGGPSISIASSMVDFSDSHYQYVKHRILIVNPTRVFGGIVNARDWPLQETIPEAFYMLTTTLDPNRGQGPGTNSWSSPLYGEHLQWAWTLLGDDIAKNQLATNRGDRYRKQFAMIQEITHGMFPGFCEKLKYSTASASDATLVGTSYVPKEMIWFTKPRFSDRITSGILFGSAVTVLTSFAPEINS